jgi:putative YhbY family RNA-binding protein
MKTLTPSERRALRARAHALDPVVIIGQHGLTAAVLKEIDSSLTAHELIKVRCADGDRDAREAALARICAELDAAPVQHLGKLLVIWRPRPEDAAPAQPSVSNKPSTTRTTRRRTGTAARGAGAVAAGTTARDRGTRDRAPATAARGKTGARGKAAVVKRSRQGPGAAKGAAPATEPSRVRPSTTGGAGARAAAAPRPRARTTGQAGGGSATAKKDPRGAGAKAPPAGEASRRRRRTP